MKKRTKLFIPALLFLSFAVVMAGCGGGDDDDTPPQLQIDDSVSTTSTQAAAASAEAVQLAGGSFNIFSSLGNIGLSSTGSGVPSIRGMDRLNKDTGTRIASSLSAAFAGSGAVREAVSAARKAVSMGTVTTISGTNVACTDGGSFDFSGTHDDKNTPNDTSDDSYSLSFTFNGCRDDGSQFDGSYAFNLNAASLTITLTSFTIRDYDVTYTNLSARLETTSFTIGFSFAPSSIDVTINGSLSAHDYISGNDYTMMYNNITASVVIDLNNGSVSIEFNNGFSESWTEGGVPHNITLTYTNFTLSFTDLPQPDGTVDDATSISGSFAYTFTPPDFCAGGNGAFTIVTITPIYWDESVGHDVAGTLVINGSVTIQFNQDGTVTVSSGTESNTYSSDYAMIRQCDFGVVGEEGP